MAVTYGALGDDFSAFLRRDARGGASLELLVKGARCAACLAKIESAVSGMPGVTAARLNLTTGKLVVGFRSAAADPGAVIGALERLGYPATPYDPAQAVEAQDQEGRRLLLALGVAAFGAGNAMMFSVPLWAGLFGQELEPAARTFMQWASALIGAPCALFAGRPFFTSAWRSLRAGRANMDVPISIGVILTLLVSFEETLLHGRDTYFDAAVSLLFLLLIGRWFDHQLRNRARGAAANLLAMQAAVASRLDAAGQERRVPLSAIAPDDRLIVRPGERIPVDGVIERGETSFDNALLTGETAPQIGRPGQACRAGALNLTGAITLRAVARAEDSAVAQIARLVEAGAQAKSRYVRLADHAASIYVPVVHTAAALTFMLGWVLGIGVRDAALRAVAVLIITCPCALGLAVPAVQVAASARLFRRGVLVKSGAALERLAEVDCVVLDKTGVLTQGQPVLIDAAPAAVALAAPLARGSRHPLAQAMADAAGPGPVAEGVVEHAGLGVEGRIDGRLARLGRADFVGVANTPSRETELWFAIDGETKIRFRFHDRLRVDAKATIEALKARGLGVEILSGDVAPAVRAVAEDLGVTTWRAAASPQDKAARIDELIQSGHRPLMVGDGLNDAAALARAHAAMAPGSALDASQNAADLVFSGHRLDGVTAAVDVARAARRRALENFGFAALYNLIAAPAAMAGLVNPFVAALAMSGSSLVVTLNALRMNRVAR